MLRALAAFATAVCMAGLCAAQGGEVRAPENVVAGTAATIGTTGDGTGTFYLIGPSGSEKRDIKLGQEIQLDPEQLQSAGRYLAIVCSDSCRSAVFFVTAAKPVALSFLVHPSRAPVGQNEIISGAALPFDEFRNLVVAPATINFELAVNGKSVMSRPETTQAGAAWFRSSSGRTAGALQVTASINGVSTRRVVQQVASDPCNLRIKGQRTPKGIEVETEPVRDCAGNPVPDGTIITFTAKAGDDTDTVDAPIKKGIAKAQLMAKGPVVISAASGVVMGNELRMGAQ